MALFLKNIACPSCRKLGHDRAGNNLALYDDDSCYCWRCGYIVKGDKVKVYTKNTTCVPQKIILPHDCSIDYPDCALTWCSQYELEKYTLLKFGAVWSDYYHRLIFPIFFNGVLTGWTGRYFGKDPVQPKWLIRGNIKEQYTLLYNERVGQHFKEVDRLFLVEDIISAIKISRFEKTLCLFGINFKEAHIRVLRPSHSILWLDPDQHIKSLKKSLETTLKGFRMTSVIKSKDPKEYSYLEIQQILKEIK